MELHRIDTVEDTDGIGKLSAFKLYFTKHRTNNVVVGGWLADDDGDRFVPV